MNERIHEGAIRDEIARQSGDSKKQLRDFSNELFDILRNNLLADGHILLHQFGSLKLKWTKERNGKNPQTGEAIIIPAHPRISFTATKALKDRVSAGEIDSIEVETAQQEPVIKPVNNIPEDNSSREDKTVNLNEKKITLSTEPYLRKNMPLLAEAEKKPSRAFPLIAASMLLFIGVYYVSLDTSNEAPLQAEKVPAVEVRTQISTLVEIEPSSDHNKIVSESRTPKKILPAVALLDKKIIIEDKPQPFFKQKDHKLANGDSLWRLSKKNYINPFFWPHIYQANKYKIKNPNKLLIGRSITLPTLLGDPKNLSAEDRRNIAEGYFLVYLYHKKTNKPFPYYALLGAEKFDPEVIQDHAYDIDEEDWNNLQLASN